MPQPGAWSGQAVADIYNFGDHQVEVFKAAAVVGNCDAQAVVALQGRI